jgi:nucleotide-binding universal stress UspA family protein
VVTTDPDAPVFRRLLVGVCEDRRSDHALRVGIDLAERWDADLEVIHAVPVRHPEWLDIDRVRLAASTAEALTGAWRELIEHLRNDLPDLRWRDQPLEKVLRVLPGHPAKLLLDQRRQSSADLIVLGAHARRGLLDFGNTARAILAKADCPLWIQVSEPAPIRSLLVPVDLSEESLSALDLGRRLAAGLGARVVVLSCFDAPASLAAAGKEDDADVIVGQVRESARRRLDQLLEQIPWGDVEPEVAFVPAEPAVEILRRQDDNQLIVMGTHGRTRFSAAVLGSTTYAVLREARIPVLVLRRKDQDWMV